MRQGTLVLALIAVVSLSGCVWKSDYKKSLAEIEGLQKVRAGLEEKSAAQERKIAELTQQKETLEKDKAGLVQENENIKSTLETKRDKLANEVVGLKNRLGDNANHIAELEQQIARLSEEKTKAVEEKERAIARMKNTYESLVNEMKQEIKEGEIQITQLKDRLTVNLVDKILFDSGSAAIKGKGQKVLDRVGEILKTVTDRQIKVEGHTDNVPISAALAEKFPSNWELSTARATTVVRYLQGRGVDPTFLSAEGYGEFQPVAPNDTDESKAKNRRIEIVLIPREVSP
jgi:chemotaxis protein MotB